MPNPVRSNKATMAFPRLPASRFSRIYWPIRPCLSASAMHVCRHVRCGPAHQLRRQRAPRIAARRPAYSLGHSAPINDGVDTMKATQLLHNLGQSIWLDNITRDLLDTGTLKQYIAELSVTGLTSNPTIFDHAFKNSSTYDASIREKLKQGKSGEALFFDLALEDLTRAADLFRPIHEQTNTVDGWVSLEVSPLLAHDTRSTLAAAKELHAPGRAAESPDQDSRHERGPAGHRGGDLCRCADQRDAAVFA